MTLRSLKIFVTVAELQNMTKAAEKLIITQSSISQAIADIEEEYNVILFDRLKNGLRLTALGENAYKYAKSLLGLYQEFENILKHDSEKPKIRIGASITVGATIMRSIIDELRKQIDNVEYVTYVENTKQIEEKILKNELDIAVVEGNVSSKDLISEVITNDKMVLICSLKHKFYGRNNITIDEIANEPLVLREERSGTRLQLIRQLEALNIEPNVVWTCNTPEVVKAAVKENFGISAISRRLVYEDLANGTLWSCNIKDAELSREFKLIYRKDKYLTKVIKEFMRITREYSTIG